jgi:hypothetical protein
MRNRHPDAVLEGLTLLLAVLRAALRDRGELLTEHLLLRHQLAVVTRPTRRRPRRRPGDRLPWGLARRLRRGWQRPLVVVRPETVVRWHRHAWRRFWRWRSRTRRGRPRLRPDVRELIAAISRDHPLWGTERIRGALPERGLAVSNRSSRRSRRRGPPRQPGQTWRTFRRSHAHAIWAADLCPVQARTCNTRYVLVFITHGRRELVHLAAASPPTAAWVWRQLIEATPWGRRPTRLIRDRDRV